MHDPRQGVRISERDIAALTFVGEGYEVAQYQLHAAMFPNRSTVVVSHFVTRALRNGWIAVERWNRVGINRLRLTSTGRDVVVNAGGDPIALFVPKKALASKDVVHTLWINDVRVSLAKTGERFTAILPAWHLQRRIVPPPSAIPDVLAIIASAAPTKTRLFASEVDLGGERLVSTFFPKLRKLHALLKQWSDGGDLMILVFTSGRRRAAAITKFAVVEQMPLIAAPLPSEIGPDGIQATETVLRMVLQRPVKSN
jgi:hypothetical protein